MDHTILGSVNTSEINSMQSNNLRWARGFTIIEVLIVLAIAGLIMIIVFLAVPSLQRSSRNTQRKHDASLITATLADFKTAYPSLWLNRIQNDNGELTSVDIMNNSDTSKYPQIKLGFYVGTGASIDAPANMANNIYINTPNTLATTKTPAVVNTSTTPDINHITTNTMAIFSGENCNSAGNAAGSLQSNAIALFYAVEDGSPTGSIVCLSA
ncbi:MAG TPA: type II secretion system protein [Candidatus Saccharimonadales bacterium]|nr:type II secretion system protein [Candidatus Saccharimonadales bacterium]